MFSDLLIRAQDKQLTIMLEVGYVLDKGNSISIASEILPISLQESELSLFLEGEYILKIKVSACIEPGDRVMINLTRNPSDSLSVVDASDLFKYLSKFGYQIHE